MPFYQFNAFTGRLKESTKFQPLYPLSPAALQKTEPPVMIYDTMHTKPIKVEQKIGSARYSTLPSHLEKAYKFFQIDVEKPVYLISGKKDRMTFTLSCIGTGATIMYAFFKTYTWTKK